MPSLKISRTFFYLLVLTAGAIGLHAAADTGIVSYYSDNACSSAITAVGLTYDKGAGTSSGPVSIYVGTTNPSEYVWADTSSLPVWLTLDASSPTVGTAIDGHSGTTSAGAAHCFGPIKLDVGPIAASFGDGNITNSVVVYRQGDDGAGNKTNNPAPLPVNLLVKSAPASLSVIKKAFNWNAGQQIKFDVTVYSSNEPVSFTPHLERDANGAAKANADSMNSVKLAAPWCTVSPSATTMAYSWGTALTITCDPVVSLQAPVSDVITIPLQLVPANGSPNVGVDITVTMMPGVPKITSFTPTAITTLPTGSTTDVTVVISGQNFVPPPPAPLPATSASVVQVAYAATSKLKATPPCKPPALVVVVNSDTTITVKIPHSFLLLMNSASPKITTDSLLFTVTTPNATATATATLSVTSAPIISAVTNGASFGSGNDVAPYEIISIFGSNFLADGNDLPAFGAPDAMNFSAFPRVLTSSSSPLAKIKATFYKPNLAKPNLPPASTDLITDAPLIFVTQNQINAVVPAEVATANCGTATNPAACTTVRIVVSTNAVASAPLLANVVSAVPGVFTAGSVGTGQGAIVNANHTINDSSHKAQPGDIVSIFLTGLGVPDSPQATTSANPPVWSTSCVGMSEYLTAVNGTATTPLDKLPKTWDAAKGLWTSVKKGPGVWTNLNGAVVLASKLGTNHLPPCLQSTSGITVTIGGQDATVSYAGMVGDSLAGLYQINAQIGTVANGLDDINNVTLTSGNSGQLPVVVSLGTAQSQAGVTLWVSAP